MSGVAAEDQRGVGAAEAEGIGQRDVDLLLPCAAVRHQVDRRLHRRVVEVDGRRRDVVADGEQREDRLDRAGRAEEVADRRLGRRHRDLAGGVAEQPLDRAELDLVAERRRGAVGVDVVDVAGASMPARFIAIRMQRSAPSPSSAGAVMW